jgi:two-component system catabolic regulation response regulator CreB
MGNHILIVEDDAAIADMLLTLLQMEGFTVAVATSGADALAWMMQRGAPVETPGGQLLEPAPRADLILLDLQLSDMNGEDMIDRLRRSSLVVPPIIVLTARREQVALAVGDQISAVAVLLKPFEIQVLLDQIGLALTQSR